ncbi:TonB-dependent receptor plug domain-containing protein [Sphingoaurantiacus capsulatus]|uniref:TonB-dependent receptor plug domain-containing protein n=1 Tax=Sphingoaurantiacus capsulatus TaxID=1771310 RepID=A0ABV7XAI2_9SPHN
MRKITKASLLAGFAFVATAAQAQDTAAVADEAETIVVTGTRAVGRTIADSPVPIDVLTPEALQNTGFTETNRVLNQLVPSFNFPQPSITDGTDVVRPATLRGLNPDQTLVLINGKRRHTTALLNINGSVGRGSAAVDINLIPSIALGRVEVLRDGAAAQYGSDAIAGVLNFQLSEIREGGRFTATYGQYESRVDGIEAFTGLAVNAAGQPVLAPDANRNGNGDIFVTNTTGKDRKVSDGQTLTVAGIVGLPLGAEGHVTVSAEFQDRDPTNRTGYDPRRQYDRIGGNVDAREFSFDRLSHRYGDAKTDDMKLFVNSALPVGESAELYAFGSYGWRDGTSGAFVRLANDARNVQAIHPNGFLPLINTELEDKAVTGGIRGELGGGIKYDLSGGYAHNAFDFFISNTLNRSFGAASKTGFDSGGLRYSQTLANLDLSKEVAVGFAQTLTVAGGLEYRRETFRIRPGEVASYAGGTAGGASGAQGFPGFAPVIGGQRVDQKRDRDNISAYAELDAEITDAFTVQVAGRYEDYSDFGSDLNGKIAARFEPAEGFALRGAVSTGFRAPSLQQQFFAASATNNVGGILLETVTLPVDNPIAIALGATPLDAETSIAYSAGFVVTAVPRFNLTVDVYQVSIDDRIVVTENLTANRAAGAANPGLRIGQILDAAGFTATNAARFFVNGVDTRTRGLDAVATYKFDMGDMGQLGATAGFNYNKTKLERVLAAPGPLATVPGVVLFGRQERIRLTDGQPRTKINLGLDWDWDWLGVTARTNRYGKVLAAGADPFLDVEIEPKWITDLELRADVSEALQLAIGSNNVFDIYPTKIPTGLGTDPANGAARAYPATNYVATYSAFSPYGFNGRFVYARASFRF